MFHLSIFNDFCSWWWLWWLLPFLLGLLLGWLIWGRLQKLIAQRDSRISELERALADCKQKNKRLSDLERSLADCKDLQAKKDRRISELEDLLAKCRSSKSAPMASTNTPKKDNNHSSSNFVASTVAPAPKQDEKKSDTSNFVASGSAPKNKYSKIPVDNLQIIEGIGPKMESILKENGVNTYLEVADKSDGELKSILDKYGDKYRIINPNEWNDQAQYAKDGKWNELIKFQKQLGGTVNDETDSKLEKIMIKLKLIKQFKQDDLKAVEGIGPKIEQLLHAGNIKTWKVLSETKVDKLQSILDAAGPRYRISDPSTWAKQADYLAKGEFDALEEYQDFLQGGRTPK